MSTSLSEENIKQIVTRVVEIMESPCGIDKGAIPEEAKPDECAMGIYQDIDECVRASKIAQEKLHGSSIEAREKIIAAIRKAVEAAAVRLSESAVTECGMGRVEDKIKKNLLAARKTPGIEDLRPRTFTGDNGLTLEERAPYGVIGAIIPCTNPTETVIANSIGMIAGGNSVVFNPHPTTKKTSIKTIQIINEAIISAGGPPDLLTAPVSPTIETAQELMKHQDIKLLCVTGGPGVVAAAMKCGKKVIAAGPGNPPCLVDETAQIEKAARDFIAGASFDNNIICICEKVLIVVDSVADEMKKALKENGAVELTQYESKKLEKIVLAEAAGDTGVPMPNKAFVGKNANLLAEQIGKKVPEDTRLLFADADIDDPLVRAEQLMPFMPMVRVRNVDEGIEAAVKVERGNRHTAVMHSMSVENLHKMARLVDTTLFVKNGPSFAGLGFGGEGCASFTIASPTGDGLTSARNFTRIRRCVLVDYFWIT